MMGRRNSTSERRGNAMIFQQSEPGAVATGVPARAARVGWWMRPGDSARAARVGWWMRPGDSGPNLFLKRKSDPVATAPGSDFICGLTQHLFDHAVTCL
jgi:hypothetical protein